MILSVPSRATKYRLSDSSDKNLATCNNRIQFAVYWLLNFVDVGVACGHRTKATQNKAYANKASTLKWPDSKHNSMPSNAVDLYAYVAGVGAIMDRRKSKRCYEYYARIAGLLEAYCDSKGYHFRWGGNWDGDDSLEDQNFNDLMHFEIW